MKIAMLCGPRGDGGHDMADMGESILQIVTSITIKRIIKIRMKKVA